MWTRYDQLAKGVVTEEFTFMGQAMQEYEIATEPQKADVWFQPEPGCEHERARHGLFGRMAETPCLVEAFHATPSAKEVLACLSKQLNLHRKLLRERARQRQAQALGRPPVLAPRLWILSAGRPEHVMRGLTLRPMDGWPPGFWQAAPLLQLHLVVLRELPKTRETLLLLQPRPPRRSRPWYASSASAESLFRSAFRSARARPQPRGEPAPKTAFGCRANSRRRLLRRGNPSGGSAHKSGAIYVFHCSGPRCVRRQKIGDGVRPTALSTAAGFLFDHPRTTRDRAQRFDPTRGSHESESAGRLYRGSHRPFCRRR